MYQVQPQQYQQQQQIIQIQPPPSQPPPPPPPQQLGPRQVQHKEAYIKYISNLRKQQHLHSLPSHSTPLTYSSLLPSGDWYASLDVRPSRIKESRVMPPPASWIENCENHNDVLKHLVSLRCYMLQDAVSIQKTNTSNVNRGENIVNGVDDMSDVVGGEDKGPVLMEL